jgi:ATP-dependent DNA helicase RecQ
VIEVLLARELLTIEAVSNYDNMPVLRLTEQGDAFLSGQDVVDVRFVEQLCDREVVAFTDNEQLLFDTLRQVRRQLANANDLPAYVICHDTALREIVLQKPMTPDALLAVRGIGARFVESYGQSFLNVLWTHV